MKVLLLAAIAGVIAGSLLLYGKLGSDVHDSATVVANTGAACSAVPDVASSLDPFIQGEMAAVQLADVPDYLGDLQFKSPEGDDITLADWKGKAVVFNLWATWCAPCRAEMPALSNLQTALSGEDFEVVAVNIDTSGAERPLAFLDEIDVSNLPLYADQTTEIFNSLKKKGLAFGMPTTLIVDKDGCRVAHLSGPAHWDSEDAKALVSAIIGKKMTDDKSS
ncbi:TlpA disulfide reductase family protein [Pararhizobium sp. IMCC21322]|uniref:thiol:disulfide interchange protein TlpA n=1 Tax=Pararhizobium sp. IMCC21322 TaxID=3067903 RepID=UPI00274038E3|nr:TlpA disulfide reductase family protein [Pararhizobium sp. IMCC21322]